MEIAGGGFISWVVLVATVWLSFLFTLRFRMAAIFYNFALFD